MQPVKLGGLTLKSEEKTEEVEEIVDAASEGLEVPEPEEGDGESNEGKVENPVIEDDPNWNTSSCETAREITIQELLTSIIKRVEEFPKDDNKIKAIGKLKGALQLLS